MDTRALERLCDNFRRGLKARLLQAGVCRLLIFGLATLPPFMLLDWWLHLTAPWRCAALAGYLFGLFAIGWWTMLRPMSQRWSNEQVLAFLDSIMPPGRGMLLDFYELAREEGIQEMSGETGRALVRSSREELEPLAEEASRLEAVRRERLRRWTLGALVTAGLFAAGAIPLAEYVSIGCERFFNPFSKRRWPHRTTITLEEPPTGWTIPQMESFEVRGKVTGLIPPQAVMAYRVESAGYWIREKIQVRDDGALVYTFPQVREPIDFYIEGGDYATDPYRIEIVERPYLKKIEAHYSYPAYAGIPDRTSAGGQLAGLEGTSVRVVFECSMALKKAVLNLDLKSGKTSEELPLTSEKTFEKTFLLSSDGSYTVELYEKHGFRESRPERYEIRVTPDNPPEVEMLSPGRDLIATRKASVDVAFRARDDFGLRKVEFLYQVDEGQPVPISDRISGPLEPKGKTKEASFKWELRRMDFPKTATVRYFVKVQDVNPTGRGVAETNRYQIKLVKPSEFHFKVFEEAKRIDMEARVAWENQYAAWERAAEWMAKGTGNENDPLWQDMKDKQELAIRAVKAMETYLKDLIRQYEQNDMRAEFMAARVGAIADMVRRVSTKEHPAIASGLDRTRPRTEADAQPDRMKQLRGEAVRGFADSQKLATLCLERILKQVFDWRDLQTTLIRTTMLHEEQEETLTATTELGPKTLGWKIEDLADDVQDKLLTLGKRQNTIYDVETELEKELEFQMFRAEKQKRKSILVPLLTAYRGLREKRVNDNLKLAASSIQANQLLPIIKNQKEALEALALVKGGLLYAGQKVDPEDTEKNITLAMVPSKIVEVEPKPAPAAKPGEEAAAEDTSPVASLPQEVLKASMGLGGDPLTAAITGAWEAQDQVRSRTKYLSENSSPEEMPRFIKCKQGILLEKQAGALEAIGRAIQEASKGGADFVKEMLEAVKRNFEQSRGLIAERQIGGGTQRLQNDSMETLDDLRRLAIPVEKAVKDVADENRSRGGIDAFNRQYLVRDKDLDHTTDLAFGLNRAHILQREVLRHLGRFANLQGAPGSLSEAEKANRARAAEAQRKAAAILQEAASRGQALSGEVASKLKAAGFEQTAALKLAPLADAIAAGNGDKELVPAIQEAVGVLEQAVAGVRNLLEERVRPQVAAKAEDETAPKMTLEEWERMRSSAYLREKLKDDDRIPPEVREIILRTLSREFPARHREMLAAYFASLLAEQKGGKAAGGGKEEEKK